jgi:hypothetical protein
LEEILNGEPTPADELTIVLGATAPPGAELNPEQVLAALAALQRLRAQLDRWEPTLIAAARDAGATWSQLAATLGVASRQAAERRYLRTRQAAPDQRGTTRDERVDAERERRAGNRAVTDWARANGSDLRQLAGQITALTDLTPDATTSVDRLHTALGGDDAALLLPLLADILAHLGGHDTLARRVHAVADRTAEIRQDTYRRRAARAHR